MVDNKELFSPPETPPSSKVPRIILGIIIGCMLFGLGWFVISYMRSSSGNVETDLKRQEVEEAENRIRKANQEALQKRRDHTALYQNIIDTDFPGWSLKGDDLISDDLSGSDDIIVNVHLKKGNKSRVVRIFLHKFYPVDSLATDDNEYWIAYRPTTFQLGNVELQKIKEEQYEAGHEEGWENPPDPPDYDPPDNY